MNILEASADPNLFARWFRDPGSWQRWFAFLAALFALPMDRYQLASYRQNTERMHPPEEPAREAWLVCGRRAGKSFVLALVAVYLACFRDYRAHLAPGERATILVLATDRKQAQVIFGYIRALLGEVPMLARMVQREAAESIDLDNRVTIAVGTASYKSTRGYTFAAVLCDELAFWPTDDSAEPDYAILGAVRPGMATIPGAVLLCASSPYARRGALFDAFARHFGRERDPVLVWRAPTLEMNPTVPPHVVADAMQADPAAAAAEYMAEFRSDVEGFVSREAVAAVVPGGVLERPWSAGQEYVAFVDPSGGRDDSMTLAIAHLEGRRAVLDALREVRPPFSPDAAVAEFAATLAAYRVRKVVGDRYAGEWPREAFRAKGVSYDASAAAKSDIYRDLLPALNSREIALLDHPRLTAQLCGLVRHTARGGRDTIDHVRGSHDDLANAAAGALTLAKGRSRRGGATLPVLGHFPLPPGSGGWGRPAPDYPAVRGSDGRWQRAIHHE
jgi:hypothetical protein